MCIDENRVGDLLPLVLCTQVKCFSNYYRHIICFVNFKVYFMSNNRNLLGYFAVSMLFYDFIGTYGGFSIFGINTRHRVGDYRLDCGHDSILWGLDEIEIFTHGKINLFRGKNFYVDIYGFIRKFYVSIYRLTFPAISTCNFQCLDMEICHIGSYMWSYMWPYIILYIAKCGLIKLYTIFEKPDMCTCSHIWSSMVIYGLILLYMVWYN